MKKNILIVLSMIGLNGIGAVVTFQFPEDNEPGAAGAALDGQTSASYTQDGLQLTATVLGPSGAEFNQTSSSFGINASGSDESAEFDDAQGAESVRFTFDRDVYLNSIYFNAMNQWGDISDDDYEGAQIDINGSLYGNFIEYSDPDDPIPGGFTDLNDTSDGHVFGTGMSGVFIPQGNTFELTYFQGNDHNGTGWELDEFTVTFFENMGGSAVPEPSSLVYMMLGGLLFAIRRNKR